MTCQTPRFRPLPLNVTLDSSTLSDTNQRIIQQLWTNTAQLINDTKSAEDELNERVDTIEEAGGADGDTIQVFLSVTNGVFFRNNLGPDKTITAQLYINGALATDTTNFLYEWTGNGEILQLDINGNVVGVVPTQGTFSASPFSTNGVNTDTIILDPNDVANGDSLNIQCKISNF